MISSPSSSSLSGNSLSSTPGGRAFAVNNSNLECVESRDSTDDVDMTRGGGGAVATIEERDEAPLVSSTDISFLQQQVRDESSDERQDTDEVASIKRQETQRQPSPGIYAALSPMDDPTTAPLFRSPPMQRGYVQQQDGHSPLHLFNHSFDSMSENGQYWQHPHSSTPPMKAGIDSISLPALDYADISPIKLSAAEMRRHRRSPAPMETQMPPAPPTQYHRSSGISNPIFVLRSSHRAFANCTFLLACVRSPDSPCLINIGELAGSVNVYRRSHQDLQNIMSDPFDNTLATRRVEASICAFGGSVTKPVRTQSASIFRKIESFYERIFHQRYQLSATTVTWVLEENPPVELPTTAQRPITIDSSTSSSKSHSRDGIKTPRSAAAARPGASAAPFSDGTGRSTPTSPTPSDLAISGVEPPKLKYRCKLCGQPKQNHNCPYRRSVQRSIGVLVQKAVNSFTAYEPGQITPALSDMNNFVSYDSYDHGDYGTTPTHPTMIANVQMNVSPDTIRTVDHSPRASLSTPDSQTPLKNKATRKRSHSEIETDMVSPRAMPNGFASMVPLRPEQYRAVTPGKVHTPGAFQYPAVPLTLRERCALSDTLFELSKQIPGVTEECTVILQNARAQGLWDLAVAELLTQILVGLFCSEGDSRLEGLRHYLLGIGISC